MSATGSGGVRNLRAMFENKSTDHSTSPPSRGRSPIPSDISSGSRPVSKVRASFVAVERPGENGAPPVLGLQRTSEVSSLGGIQEDALDTTSFSDKALAPMTSTAKDSGAARPAQAPPTAENAAAEDGGLGKILKGSAFVEPGAAHAASPGAKNLGARLAAGQIKDNTARAAVKTKDDSKAAAMVAKMQTQFGHHPEPPPPTKLNTTKTAEPVKPLPTRQAPPKMPLKSPTVAKDTPKTPTSPVAHIKGGPAKIKGVMESAKEAQKSRDASKLAANAESAKVEKAPAGLKLQKAPAAPKLDAPGAVRTNGEAKKPPTSPSIMRSPQITKARSPTRPAKLPPGATATTAAAAAKETHTSPTEAETRKAAVKKPSTLSMRAPRLSSASTTSTLSKKTSRASLTNGHERPVSRVSVAKPDEGFLARMMRPTASSAQKTHEKIQVHSPPRPRPQAAAKARDPEATKKTSAPKTSVPAKHEEDKDIGQSQLEETRPGADHPAALRNDEAEEPSGRADEVEGGLEPPRELQPGTNGISTEL